MILRATSSRDSEDPDTEGDASLRIGQDPSPSEDEDPSLGNHNIAWKRVGRHAHKSVIACSLIYLMFVESHKPNYTN